MPPTPDIKLYFLMSYHTVSICYQTILNICCLATLPETTDVCLTILSAYQLQSISVCEKKKTPTTKRDTNLRDYFSSDGHVMFILSIAAYSRKKLECEYVSLVPSQAPWARMEGFASGTVVPSDEHIWSPKTLLTTCATCCLKAVMWVPFRNVYAGGSKGNGILRP